MNKQEFALQALRNAGARSKVFDPYNSRIENEQQELEALRIFYNIMTSEDAHTEVLDALIKDEENLAVWAELAVTYSELVMFYEEQRRAEESGLCWLTYGADDDDDDDELITPMFPGELPPRRPAFRDD